MFFLRKHTKTPGWCELVCAYDMVVTHIDSHGQVRGHTAQAPVTLEQSDNKSNTHHLIPPGPGCGKLISFKRNSNPNQRGGATGGRERERLEPSSHVRPWYHYSCCRCAICSLYCSCYIVGSSSVLTCAMCMQL